MAERAILIEQEILGWMLTDCVVLDEGVALCDPDLFIEPLHRRVFEAACGLHSRGERVDGFKVADCLKGDPALQLLGAEYVTRSLPSASDSPATIRGTA